MLINVLIILSVLLALYVLLGGVAYRTFVRRSKLEIKGL
jgi:uncharacterized SAM-binding protein YcdF (DUF218 family)